MIPNCCFVSFYPETVEKESTSEIWAEIKIQIPKRSLKDFIRFEIAYYWQPHSPDKVGFSFLVVASWWIAVTRTTPSNLNFINSFLLFLLLIFNFHFYSFYFSFLLFIFTLFIFSTLSNLNFINSVLLFLLLIFTFHLTLFMLTLFTFHFYSFLFHTHI